jgi:hypothetical protein
MRRDAIEITQLKDSQPQNQSHGRFNVFDLSPGIMADQVIELALEAQASKHELRRKPGIASVHSRCLGQQKVARIPTRSHQLQNVVRDSA